MAGEPIIAAPLLQPSFEWRGRESGTTRKFEGAAEPFADVEAAVIWAEKIVGPNNLRPVSFLEYGIAISRCVAHITLPGRSMGTGFLIDEDVLLTNNHVLPDLASAREAIVRFNYEDDLAGNAKPVDVYKCIPDDGFHTSPYQEGRVDPQHLDYTIVRLDRPAARLWGKLVLADNPAEARQDVIVVQHPAGHKKQIAITDNEVELVDDLVIQYLTDTLPGSSGSPVFDDMWRLVGVHHAGGFFMQPGDPAGHLRNEAIRPRAILADLPDWFANGR